MGRVVLGAYGVGKTFTRGSATVRALDGVDMTVEAGELVAIMGPSGCGKSTLLHLLAGIDTPTTGRILVDGVDLEGYDVERRAEMRRRTLGLLFQTHALLPSLTVAENAALPLTLAGVGQTDSARQAGDLLALVGLADRAGDLPDDLSGGQRQRVALARALANSPRVVLADEPTGALDRTTARDVLTAMIGLLRARGVALVMVTHDAEAAARADRTIWLRDGHVQSPLVEERAAYRVATTGGGR